MKFFAALRIAAAVMLVFIARAVHADAVPVQTRPAPVLAAGPWLNGQATTLAAQKGKVVVLLFWTRDCINCKHNLGYWNEWAQKYRGTDVAVLSVHTPETRFERSPAATARFAREHGLRFPILVDNDAHVWNAYGVESWPTEILIDKQERIRAEYAGELNWEGSGEYRTVQRKIEVLRVETQTARR
ncbi:MAG: redoxin domain-containing protein [Armatimonadota bacterium]|nr:redoxin domain-containing protein [Armatimonadota bacterium]